MTSDPSLNISDFENATGVPDAVKNYSAPEPTSPEEFIFQCSVLGVGVVGTLANGIVITIFIAGSIGTKLTTSNKFILNQLALDCFSCMWLILAYGWKIVNSRLDRRWNYTSCLLIGSEIFIWIGIVSSATNLIFITLERYAKIVHHSFHQNYYRNWMTYLAMAMAWTTGITIGMPVVVVTISYEEGICNGPTNWPQEISGFIFSIFLFVIDYAVPVLVFIFCYWRILVTMKTSAGFFDGQSEANQAVKDKHNQNKVALIKTMVIITVVFGSCWSPNNILYLIMTINIPSLAWITMKSSIWYFTLFVGSLTACIHPFIYGVRVEIVRNFIRQCFKRRNLQKPSQPFAVEEVTVHKLKHDISRRHIRHVQTILA